MTFKTAVLATCEIAGAYREGLQGVSGEYRSRIRPGCDWRGSVDLDTTLSKVYPNDPRWDYAIGFGYASRQDSVAYVEVHPASSTGTVDEVIRKQRWLVRWLCRAGKHLNGLTNGVTKYIAFTLHPHPCPLPIKGEGISSPSPLRGEGWGEERCNLFSALISKRGGFFWVATGSVSFHSLTPQGLRLAKAGIRQPAKVIRIE